MQTILTFLLTSTLFLAISGVVLLLLTRLRGFRSSRLTQIAWCLVLLQGIVVFRCPVNLPLLTPEENRAYSSQTRVTFFPPHETPIPTLQDATPQGVSSSQPLAVKPPFTWKVEHTTQLLFAIWILGMTGLIVRQYYAWLQTLNMLLSQDTLSDEHQLEWLSLLEEENIDPAKLRLMMTESLGPGLFQLPRGAAVVIPNRLWQEASPAVRCGILRHELSHYRHHDLVKSFLLRLITLLHWFNPIAWLAIRRFEEAVEWRCDIEAFGHNPQGGVDFAEALLVFRDTTPTAAVYHHAFCNTNIITRVKRLIEHKENKGDSLMKKIVILTVTALLFGLGLFQFHLIAKPLAEEKESSVEAHEPGEKDIKYIQVRGKTLLPDDQPAKMFEIQWVAHPRNQKSMMIGGNNYVADDGTFVQTVPVNSDGIIALMDPENRWATPCQLISVDDKDLAEELVFQFEPGVKISGTVRDKKTGKPIPYLGMMLHLHSGDDDHQRSVNFNKNADKNGRYEWRVSSREKTYITVGREYGVTALDKVNEEGLSQEDRQFFQQQFETIKDYVRKAEFGGPKEITLDFSIPTPFVGKILQADGSPAVDVNVQIVPSDERDIGTGVSCFTQTDQEGLFRCTKKPRNVSVQISDYRNKEYYLNWFEEELCEDGEHVFQLKPSCTIKGRLLDAATGEPMPEQLLFYWASDPANPNRKDFTPSSAKTDQDGFFTLNRDLADNVRYDLFILPIRIELRDVLLEKPGETIDLGDIKVDFTQAKRVEK